MGQARARIRTDAAGQVGPQISLISLIFLDPELDLGPLDESNLPGRLRLARVVIVTLLL
jgi:hypothetical protein